jgi:hypothetical protein
VPPSIASASRALRLLLDRELTKSMPGLKVTMTPPDRAREGGAGRQVNAYLFDLHEDAARRNAGLGSLGASPLALTLHYIVTAYGEDDESSAGTDSHVVLGAVLSVLKGAQCLTLGQSANDGFATVSLTRIPIDELCRLWSVFQTPYRLSTICEVSIFHGERADDLGPAVEWSRRVPRCVRVAVRETPRKD